MPNPPGAQRGPFPVMPRPPETPPRQYTFHNSFQDNFDSHAASGYSGQDQQAPFEPPIIMSPIKRRRGKKTVNGMSDLEAWSLSDSEICDAAVSAWQSDVYSHYNLELIRNYKSDGSPSHLTFVFRCKTHPENHPNPPTRDRSNTGVGTSNLKKDVDRCLRAQGITPPVKSNASSSALPYSEANHRALIALRSAKYNRPVNMVTDEEYLQEVNMLRPGTIPPSPSTVARDLHKLYEEMSIDVKKYFLSLTSAIHLVLDGWTAPIVLSYLGLVIVWCHEGVIQRSILEFISLKQEHTGKYLAEVVSSCLKKWGLNKKLLGICMDNASNCSKMAQFLKSDEYLPDFWGMDARLRCLAHIVNLIAKIFISFFFKKPKLKKSTTVARGTDNEEVTEFVLDNGDERNPGDEDDPAFEEAQEDARALEEDDGQIVHDEEVVRSICQLAIRDMAKEGLKMTPKEEEEALKLFPAV
ncbi:hypothetical protein CVT26_006537 [Gymnopilus dilepis]|uniref:DUF659 domain-containing protein n=1 Tax=Gymnopilus dilepis TaxID=231916 RepID=A0A409X0W4_9AGAR|nr:hypothetical protein CVT26_006537 [Gymnopilus dilepis]